MKNYKLLKFYKSELDDTFQIPHALLTESPHWFTKGVDRIPGFPKYIYPSKSDILWVGRRGEQVTCFEILFRNKKMLYGIDKNGEYFLCDIK